MHLNDGPFFLPLQCLSEQVSDFRDFWAAGQAAGYEVLVVEMPEGDPQVRQCWSCASHVSILCFTSSVHVHGVAEGDPQVRPRWECLVSSVTIFSVMV